VSEVWPLSSPSSCFSSTTATRGMTKMKSFPSLYGVDEVARPQARVDGRVWNEEDCSSSLEVVFFIKRRDALPH
jgi:hypothetical protein